MLKITGIAKTEVIFVYSLISGNAPNLQVTLQSQKIKKKKSTVPVLEMPCCAVLQKQHNFLSQMKI